MAEAGAGQDEGGDGRVADVDGDAGGDQGGGGAGVELERRVQAGVQVDGGGAWRIW